MNRNGGNSWAETGQASQGNTNHKWNTCISMVYSTPIYLPARLVRIFKLFAQNALNSGISSSRIEILRNLMSVALLRLHGLICIWIFMDSHECLDTHDPAHSGFRIGKRTFGTMGNAKAEEEVNRTETGKTMQSILERKSKTERCSLLYLNIGIVLKAYCKYSPSIDRTEASKGSVYMPPRA